MMKTKNIKDIKIPMQVVLGGCELAVEEIAAMTEGTIIELDSLAGEPVDLTAGGEVIAKGEVVVIDENFGIRVTRVLEGEDENG